jgi:glycosyltransferase involved in cell wall biosynthesis
VAPSHDAAAWFRAAFPDVAVDVVPHPQTGVSFPAAPRAADLNRIALLGAIGPHKGSRALLDIARRARLLEPQLQFHVIGHTDIDQELLRLGNVTITGPYKPDELAGLIEASGVGAALFLHGWPETFSYTLTEAVSHGLLPIVPDIGAPAERVRAAGWGVVFPFPIDPPGVVRLLARLGRDGIDAGAAAGKLSGFASTASAEALRALLNVSPDAAAGEGMSHSLLKTA